MSKKLTQTELAQEFGISSIAMGKKLVALNLKDANNKLVTQYAFDNKLGKNVTYNKLGQEIKISIWNEQTIKFIKNNLKTDFDFCSDILIGKLKNLKKLAEIENQNGRKIDAINYDFALEDFNFYWHKNKTNLTTISSFIKKMEKEKLIDFSIGIIDEIQTIKISLMKENLENQIDKELTSKNTKEKINKI